MEFGLDQKQIRNIAQNIPKGTYAGFLLIEHPWAKKSKKIALKKNQMFFSVTFTLYQSQIDFFSC